MLCGGVELCIYSTCMCMNCGQEWKPSDPKQPGVCPSCEQDDYERVRCIPSDDKPEGCVLTKLHESTSSSKDIGVLSEIREIENQLALKLTVTIDQIRADVYPALLMLAEERERYSRENPNK